MVELWPESLPEHVSARSSGRVAIGTDAVVGRYLVAARDLPANEVVLEEEAMLAGSDEARSLRAAVCPDDAEGMLDAWERPDGEQAGGSNPLAHFDLFCAFALLRHSEAKVAGASERLARLQKWFCVPHERWVDRAEQKEKLEMIHEALRAPLRKCTSVKDLRLLDDILNRNAEEFTGAAAVFHGGGGRPSYFNRRRFQGIFPCKDLIQHSCAPNCITVAGPLEGSLDPSLGKPSAKGCNVVRLMLQVIPLRPIAAGERLTWNYLPYWKWLWPTHLRQEALREGWDFLCGCERCTGDLQETTMAFVCPACGRGDLCPSGPCAAARAADISQDSAKASESCCSAGHGHRDALRQLTELTCGGCDLRLRRGDVGGLYSGFMERCLAQEEAVFALPWRGVLGRDPSQIQPAGGADLLSETHWLRADYASHLLENAPAICKEKGLAAPDADLACLRAQLTYLADAATSVEAALVRLLGHKRASILPELAMSKALATGQQHDWEACRDTHRRVYAGCRAGLGAVVASEQLRASCHGFAATGLRLEPAAAERLALQLEGVGSFEAAGTSNDDLADEVRHVHGWVGRANVYTGAFDGNCNSSWVLRRMWLCPGYGAPEDPADAEQTDSDELSAESGRKACKRPAKSPLSRVQTAVRKRPAGANKSTKRIAALQRKPSAAAKASPILRKPAAAGATKKLPATRLSAVRKRPSACPVTTKQQVQKRRR